MPVRKTAVSLPEELVDEIDKAAEARGESRSRYIARVLRLAVRSRRDAEITDRLNELFADESTRTEQQRVTQELDEAGSDWTEEGW